jgi:hypothetical protein
MTLCCVSKVPVCIHPYVYVYVRTHRTAPGEVKRTVHFCNTFSTILISQVNNYKLKYYLRYYPISNINDVKSIQIILSESNGETLLCESHIVSFGPGGLLRVPEPLGYVADDLLCFPTEEEANDIANQ